MDENGVLCEKIISDINAVLERDPDLSSFEIIPTILNQNKSPVIHVEHNLGLESWCIKWIYDYSHNKILLNKSSKHQQKHNDTSLVKYLNVGLLINPDVTSFWHMRRQLIEKSRLKVHQEFLFSALVLSKKPKSSEAFAYRRWLFSFQSFESIDWSVEIGICDRCADKSSSNYHAWSHRLWVLQKAPTTLLKSEVILTEKFIKKHISDYSCYHYRHSLLDFLFEQCFYCDIDDADSFSPLKDFINYCQVNAVSSTDEILSTMLPKLMDTMMNQSNGFKISPRIRQQFEKKIKSLLYCCNLAAFDMKLCDELKNLYGSRESFENHRRASLKFIVDNCVKMNGIKMIDQCSSPVTKHCKYDYTENEFLLAVKKSEAMLGEKHRQWCSLFLGFDFST